MYLEISSQPQDFESMGQNNGVRYWFARDFMEFLGYSEYGAFSKAINKAIAACTALNISIVDNFIQHEREFSGHKVADYRLTRFACYLTAMNADSRKPQVAAAQAYFAALAEAVRDRVLTVEGVERVLIRDKISEQEKSLSGVAKQAGVVNYPFFQNAGYRGMYNMDLKKLKVRKGVDEEESLLDFMGKQELAANLFRITQTEAKIKNEGLLGQARLEEAAKDVGRRVRRTMEEISGDSPENLPIDEHIKLTKKALRETHKKFRTIDNKSKPARLNGSGDPDKQNA